MTATHAQQEEPMSTFFVRALFDFNGTDASSLSFRRGDIIEVLTQLESGWWDGLLDDERGWFPSNYVVQISDQEAEEELAARHYAAHGQPELQTQTNPRAEWAHDEVSERSGIDALAEASMSPHTGQSSDFWVPQVTPDGQIYYINTITGEQSRDLPSEVDDSDPNHIPLATQARSRSGTNTTSSDNSSRQGSSRQGTVSTTATSTAVGFGFFKRTNTPEPWVKRLADDGMSYYYLNTLDGQVRWTIPSPDEDSIMPSSAFPTRGIFRSRADSSASVSANNSRSASSENFHRATDGYNLHLQRLSVYSDDSEVNPMGRSDPDLQSHFHSPTARRPGSPTSRNTMSTVNALTHSLTSAEIVARQLQDRLAPPAPPSLVSFSESARDAIAKVAESFSELNNFRGPGSDQADFARAFLNMAERVTSVVVAVRNLLYVSGTLTGPLPGGITAPMLADESTRQELKPYQRKVTATLSKLVLSARAAGSPDWGASNLTASSGLNRSRVESEAAELDRALVTFVLELQRSVTKRQSRSTISRLGESTKRLKGVLVSGEGAAGIGLGLPGAGCAGNWKGAGYVPLDENFVTRPQRKISSETVDELVASKGRVEERLNALGEVVKLCKREPTSTMQQTLCPADQLIYTGRLSVAYLSTLLAIVEDIDLSAQVSVDAAALGRPEISSGSKVDQATISSIASRTGLEISETSAYLSTLTQANSLLRTFEFSKQAVYDDGIALVMAVQSAVWAAEIVAATRVTGHVSVISHLSRPSSRTALDVVESVVQAIRAHMNQILHSLNDLVAVATSQDVIRGQVKEIQPEHKEPAQWQDQEVNTNPYQYQSDPYAHQEADEEYVDFAQAFLSSKAPPSQNASLPQLNVNVGGLPGYSQNTAPSYGRQDVNYNSDSQGESSRPFVERARASTNDVPPYSLEGRSTTDSNRSRSASQSGYTPTVPGSRYEDSPTSTFVGSTFATPASSYSNGTILSNQVTPFSPAKTPSVGDTTLFDDDDDEESGTTVKSQQRGAKLKKVLGEVPDHYLQTQNQDSIPWYLRPIYGPPDILISPDGGVRGGTLPALIERLTMHDNRDAKFNDTFLMTFKSFATCDEVFDQLVQRFNIQTPEGLTPEQSKEWTDSKLAPIRIRVINIFKSMIIDDDVLDKDDAPLLVKIRDFAQENMSVVPAAKQLIGLVERAQRAPDSMRTLTISTPHFPPPSIVPKNTRKLKLLDIDSLELARQLTLLESELFFKIRQGECLARAKDSTPDGVDNIKNVISTSNKVADWVADSILSKDDSRKRANVIRMFISVADRCRSLNNFSTMAALIAGLNCPPIRRLKRTWEQVNARMIAQLDDLEKTLDSGKNFTAYKALLAKIDPPCVPFLGVYLTLLTFIQDGNKDVLVKEGNLINFNKRQKTAEIIREIKQYQSKPYNLARIPPIRAFIDESLGALEPSRDFWELSLEREPREREDEKMARLLQESGFL